MPEINRDLSAAEVDAEIKAVIAANPNRVNPLLDEGSGCAYRKGDRSCLIGTWLIGRGETYQEWWDRSGVGLGGFTAAELLRKLGYSVEAQSRAQAWQTEADGDATNLPRWGLLRIH